MENIKKIINRQSKLRRYQKPLEAAYICKIADSVAHDRYRTISFKNGLLTVAVNSSAAAASLQAERASIIGDINQKIGENKVKRIRFKISN